MALLTMDWKGGKPTDEFVGFAIECKAPDSKQPFALENRLSFAAADGSVDETSKSTRLSPLQKFRWVHFPRDAEVDGKFTYKVTPVFMDAADALTYGAAQEVDIVLGGETYPGKLNVTFTRGFVSSQAFVDRFEKDGKISTLVPSKADAGLDFKPTHPDADEALNWMGFEARRAILALLDEAIADKDAQVRVVAYDLNTPEIVTRLEQLGDRLKVIVDDSDAHGEHDSAETAAAKRLAASAGADHVKRQHMGDLQHNKSIVVDGPKVKAAVGGSTNMSWRGLYVQSNNAVILHGEGPVKAFTAAFDSYWDNSGAAAFGATEPAQMGSLGLDGIDASVAFSPHVASNALLATIAEDIGTSTKSSLLYSMAFLSQTEGPIKDAIKKVTEDPEIFVYGIADREVDGFDLQTPAGNVAPVFSSALGEDVPEPFKSEPVGGSGIRMHHKFAVIDFDKPTARVYLGSYNFSDAADTKNGENLLLIKDPGVVAAYTVEALRIFDHYRFRVAEQEAKDADDTLTLAKPPKAGEKPWWDKYWTDPQKRRDREVFA
ncbi:MAG TPA: phospholipase D-like domain-containing protein [Solirubrobacterales bacterium]|nr:phospholipase D-like domain-containing protein [Solirubrobacterales bacterium]